MKTIGSDERYLALKLAHLLSGAVLFGTGLGIAYCLFAVLALYGLMVFKPGIG